MLLIPLSFHLLAYLPLLAFLLCMSAAIADVPVVVGIPAVAGTVSFIIILCMLLEKGRGGSVGGGTEGDGSATFSPVNCL
jgi:hypothetical protein